MKTSLAGAMGHPSTRMIIAACKQVGLLRNECAYVLATAYHETGGYKWMREIWGPTTAQKRYEGRADLGNTQKGDGKRFMGRGFVQITGRRNYTDWSNRLGRDLLEHPELAEKPEVAATILVDGMRFGTFTGKKLSDYMTLKRSNFIEARRIVNGMDRAELIRDYAVKFNALLLKEGYGVEKAPEKPADAHPPVQPSIPIPGAESEPRPLLDAPEPEDKPVSHSKRFWTWLTTGGGTALVPFVDWRVQFLIVVVVVGFAIYAIATMPAVRRKLGLAK